MKGGHIINSDITIEWLRAKLIENSYICDDEIIVTIYLALKMEKPLLVTGAPGVGKTEIAKVLSSVFSTDLIRLQCYEGLDESKALYEWNYQRQLLKIQICRETGIKELGEDDLFSPEYLLARPLLQAIQSKKKVVLLIDEVDKTDEEFEAFLLELLSDFQVSIPEMGTVVARQIPIVILTSNEERELSEGLKRRCLYLHINYPTIEKEVEIIRVKVPEVGRRLAEQIARFMSFLRSELEFKKNPAVAETLDWARALAVLNAQKLEPKVIENTLNVILKNKEDQEKFIKKIGAEKMINACLDSRNEVVRE